MTIFIAQHSTKKSWNEIGQIKKVIYRARREKRENFQKLKGKTDGKNKVYINQMRICHSSLNFFNTSREKNW